MKDVMKYAKNDSSKKNNYDDLTYYFKNRNICEKSFN